MHKLFFAFSIFFFLLLSEISVSGEETQEKVSDNLIFDGYYRGRFDIYSGVNMLAYGDASINSKGNIKGSSNDTIYLHQIVAGFTYTPSADWEIKVYMYDARSWGSSLKPDDFTKNIGTSDEYGASYYDEHFELHETYLKKHNFLTKELTFTIGRLQLEYGDSRIIAPGVWGNTIGFLWDAAHLSYKQEKNFVDVWYGQTRTKDADEFSLVNKHQYQGIGLYSHYEKSNLNFEPFAVWRNTLFHDTVANENAYYYGARSYDESPGFVYDATFAKEIGSNGDLEIDAYGYALKVGYQFDNVYKSKFTIGSIYATGDKNPTDSKKQTFATPFGAITGPHYGRMDIMVWSNMKDSQAAFSFKPTKELLLETAYHRYELAEANDKWYPFNYANLPGNNYADIGDEYDVTLKYKATNNLDFTAIWTYLNAGDFITKNDIAQNDATKMFFQFLYKFSSK
ncbi:alginate export family protein [bacterium]|nr:alginate export family protein [bacterium]MBU1994905.1 alginate export family protein [bacterium]